VVFNFESITLITLIRGNFVFELDGDQIPRESKNQLQNLDILILNALGFDPHPTHFSLSQALTTVEELKPKRTILTHINHKFDHGKVSLELPRGVELAYDGMAVEC
jgi:phosphoribosyl 1,2-cyclic phosphate phosphodiesterase